MKLKILFLLIILIGFSKSVFAAQILPKNIIKNIVNITASKTGEVGKNYFYCKGGKKCSTEQVVREYFENEGYNVMRAEYSFWSGMFESSFLNEYYQDVYEDFCKDKRKNEKLSDSQIKWGEFLIKNRIRYKLVRVVW